MSGDVLAPAASRGTVRADDRAALATGAAPGVADPVQPVAAEPVGPVAQLHRSDRDVMDHRSSIARLVRRVTRRALSRRRLELIRRYARPRARHTFAA